MIGDPSLLSTESRMSRERDTTSIPVLETSAEWPVPQEAVELLRECMRARKDGAAPIESIRAAVAVMCADAHRLNVMPERFLVSIKDLCHSLPEYERMRGARERGAFLDRVVAVAIEEYYRG